MLGALGFVAAPAPAMAQSFSFSFGIEGGGTNFSWSKDRYGKRVKRDCLTNNEIVRGLRRLDFEDVRFLDRRGNRVSVVAEYDPNNRLYKLKINRCSGKVTDIERVRIRDWHDDDYDDNWDRGRGRNRY